MTRLPVLLFAFFAFLIFATSLLASESGPELQASEFGTARKPTMGKLRVKNKFRFGCDAMSKAIAFARK
jgi:hypothetical protein